MDLEKGFGECVEYVKGMVKDAWNVAWLLVALYVVLWSMAWAAAFVGFTAVFGWPLFEWFKLVVVFKVWHYFKHKEKCCQ